MKRRVLCIFVLILWGLVFCTMLSVRIEQLMIPEVVLTQADESEPSPHIALDSLFFDDTGCTSTAREKAPAGRPARAFMKKKSIIIPWAKISLI